MMLPHGPLAFLALLPWTPFVVVLGAPALESSTPLIGQAIPLTRRTSSIIPDADQWGLLAKAQRDAVSARYFGGTQEVRRSSGSNLITNQMIDLLYYGTLAIGTPPVSFNVLLDMGLADLWVLGTSCGTLCNGFPMYNSSASSSFQNTSTSFATQYGVYGGVSGHIATETVEMAGFSVASQGIGVIDIASLDMPLFAPVSGFLGLAWETLAVSQRMPFWQALASSGALDSPLFAIQLTRYINDTDAVYTRPEPGGVLNLGYTNSSLYTGSIEYIDIPNEPSYWYIPLTSLTVQGESIALGSNALAVIDTKFRHIAGPATAVEAIYAQIPGSHPSVDGLAGYYEYPCSTTVNVTFSFGGATWAMAPADFLSQRRSPSRCVGVFYGTTSTGLGLSWVIGSAFLKNVYSVFRYNPPSVGFAALSDVALAQNGLNNVPPPSPSIGSASAAVTSVNVGVALRVPRLAGVLFGIVLALASLL